MITHKHACTYEWNLLWKSRNKYCDCDFILNLAQVFIGNTLRIPTFAERYFWLVVGYCQRVFSRYFCKHWYLALPREPLYRYFFLESISWSFGNKWNHLCYEMVSTEVCDTWPFSGGKNILTLLYFFIINEASGSVPWWRRT